MKIVKSERVSGYLVWVTPLAGHLELRSLQFQYLATWSRILLLVYKKLPMIFQNIEWEIFAVYTQTYAFVTGQSEAPEREVKEQRNR